MLNEQTFETAYSVTMTRGGPDLTITDCTLHDNFEVKNGGPARDGSPGVTQIETLRVLRVGPHAGPPPGGPEAGGFEWDANGSPVLTP